MFVDKVTVEVMAGDGGNGVVSFRHEKFVDKGGPDGGNGGKGGDVVLLASRNQNTLAAFRYQKLLKAAPGSPGAKRKRHGKSGKDLEVPIPLGTVVINNQDQVIVDMATDGQKTIIANGGRGGFGNAHFASSRRQAPRIAEKGETGDKVQLTFELKMIADVGLIGLPNAGKSTLLKSVSNAKPEIADYPFTTLTPNLGVVDLDPKTSLLMADIPGLIAGASQGKGLGVEFLRHVERTSVLIHLIDFYEDTAKAYTTIQNELKNYSIDLTKRPQIVVLNKIDGADGPSVKAKLSELKRLTPAGTVIMPVSALSHQGIKELLFKTSQIVKIERAKAKRSASKTKLPVLKLTANDSTWQVQKSGNGFVVNGAKIERFAARTDFNNTYGVERLRDILNKMGITRELERQGIQPGELIVVGKNTDQKLEF